MKKIFIPLIVILSFIMGCQTNNCNVMAESGSSISYYEYYTNGYYAEITVNTDATIPLSPQRAYISGSKTYTYKNSSNQTLWSYTIYGTFSYTGTSATCTYDDDSYDISDDNWHMNSHSHNRSGNTAYGTVTMKKKVLGITVDTVTRDITLACSSNGTLS